MSTMTLNDYQRAELALTAREARTGILVHAVVTLLIWAVLIPVNVLAAAEFPWSAFVVAGTGIGLLMHWLGYRHVETDVRRRQAEVERLVRSGQLA
jgi:2TM domain